MISFGGNNFFVYDISDHEVSAYGNGVIISSLRTLGAPVNESGYWYGGEFIICNNDSFQTLSAAIYFFWPKYADKYRTLHHMGDEMVVTTALKTLQQYNTLLIDGSLLSLTRGWLLVARWWSARTHSEQVPFRAAAEASLRHLPADKPFLAHMSNIEFNPARFLQENRYYAAPKLLARRLTNPMLNFRDGQSQFVGHLI